MVTEYEALEVKLEKSSPTVGTSRAAQVMGNERSRWEALLPQDKATWLQWFIDQPLEVSLSMIVFGTTETAHALQGRGSASLSPRDQYMWP